VSMTFESFSELMLMTKIHYEAWLSAWYLAKNQTSLRRTQQQAGKDERLSEEGPMSMF